MIQRIMIIIRLQNWCRRRCRCHRRSFTEFSLNQLFVITHLNSIVLFYHIDLKNDEIFKFVKIFKEFFFNIESNFHSNNCNWAEKRTHDKRQIYMSSKNINTITFLNLTLKKNEWMQIEEKRKEKYFMKNKHIHTIKHTQKTHRNPISICKTLTFCQC